MRVSVKGCESPRDVGELPGHGNGPVATAIDDCHTPKGGLHSSKLTISHLKMDGWNTILFSDGLFSGANC